MLKNKYWVVLPASGIGSRMNTSCPKQYLSFAQSTVIETTLKTLLDFDAIEGAVVVVSKEDDYWPTLKFSHNKPIYTTIGAAERSGSVFCGLQKIREVCDVQNLMVMIHDAVRPCITHSDLQLLVDQCEAEQPATFLAHPVTDTLKKSNDSLLSIATVERSNLWRAFTPQVFAFDLIFKALQLVERDTLEITDDVSAVEQLGVHSKIVMGRSDNIKITYPSDLKIAELILENQKQADLLAPFNID